MDFQYGQIVFGEATTATAGGTTALVNNSKQIQYFTGSANQTVTLPSATTMVVGQFFEIYNQSTGTLTIENQDSSSFSAAPSVSSGKSLVVKLVANGTANGTWVVQTGTGGGSSARTINAQTGTTYTLALTDGSASGDNPLLTMSNSGPQTITIPLNSSVAFPVGSQVDVISLGTGTVTFSAAGGVTLDTNLATLAQYVQASLVQISTNTWVLYQA